MKCQRATLKFCWSSRKIHMLAHFKTARICNFSWVLTSEVQLDNFKILLTLPLLCFLKTGFWHLVLLQTDTNTYIHVQNVTGQLPPFGICNRTKSLRIATKANWNFGYNNWMSAELHNDGCKEEIFYKNRFIDPLGKREKTHINVYTLAEKIFFNMKYHQKLPRKVL